MTVPCRDGPSFARAGYISNAHRWQVWHWLSAFLSIYPWDNSPLVTNLLLAESVDIPLPSPDSSWHHSYDLVHEERPGGDAPTRGNPETEPLNPLAEVMRIKNIAKEHGLRNTVVLIDTDPGVSSLLLFSNNLLLTTLLGATNLPELIVMQVVSYEANEEDGDTNDELRGRKRCKGGGPFAVGDGAIGGKVRAEAGGVNYLERRSEEEDGRVDG